MSPLTFFQGCITLVLISYKGMGCEAVDTTIGFVSVPLNQSNFKILKPYDIPLEQRYNFSHGVLKLWVIKTDKPHSITSHTHPRTEIQILAHDYSSGVWQFEAYGYVPCGTTGVCIMQLFGADPPHATTAMLHVYNGSLYYYRSQVIVPHIYNKWFRVNVIHDVEGNYVKIYIDGVIKYEGTGRGGKFYNFKCGVYEQYDAPHQISSFYMESRWKDIKVLKKCD